MNTLDFAIITDFQRTKLINDSEELSENQLNFINDMTDKAYSLITKNDFNSMLSENEENTFYTDIKNKVMKTLEENNLSFYDNRCYGYLIDGVYSMLSNSF